LIKVEGLVRLVPVLQLRRALTLVEDGMKLSGWWRPQAGPYWRRRVKDQRVRLPILPFTILLLKTSNHCDIDTDTKPTCQDSGCRLEREHPSPNLHKIHAPSSRTKIRIDDSSAPLASLAALLELLETLDVDVAPGGRTGLGAGALPVCTPLVAVMLSAEA
jgi:hypothetical protein